MATPYPGMDLGGIRGILDQFKPSPEEVAQRRRDALMLFLLGLGNAKRGHEAEAIGRSGLFAYGAMQNQNPYGDVAQRMQLAQGALGLSQALQQGQAQRELADIGLRGQGAPSAGPAMPAPGLPAGSVGGTGMGGGTTGLFGGSSQPGPVASAAPPTPQAPSMSDYFAHQAALYEQAASDPKYSPATRLEARKRAETYRVEAYKAQPKVKDVRYDQTADGQPFTWAMFEDGTVRQLPGIVPREKINWQNAGGQLVPRGEYGSTPQNVAPIPVSVSPNTQATVGATLRGQDLENKRGWASIGIAQQNANRPDFSQVAGTVNGQPAFALFEKRSGRFLDPNTQQPIPNFTPTEGGQVLPTAEGYARITPSNQVRPIFDTEGKRVMPQPAATIQERMAANDAALSNISLALTLARENPDAFGVKNLAPDVAVQRLDPKGVQARAVVSGISGQKFHDLSGAAVSVTEAQRLKPYIPNTSDTGDAVVMKLENLAREYAKMNEELANGRPLAEVISKPATGAAVSKPKSGAPPMNAKGWRLHVDKNGNKAYVSPDGKQYEEVR